MTRSCFCCSVRRGARAHEHRRFSGRTITAVSRSRRFRAHALSSSALSRGGGRCAASTSSAFSRAGGMYSGTWGMCRNKGGNKGLYPPKLGAVSQGAGRKAGRRGSVPRRHRGTQGTRTQISLNFSPQPLLAQLVGRQGHRHKTKTQSTEQARACTSSLPRTVKEEAPASSPAFFFRLCFPGAGVDTFQPSTRLFTSAQASPLVAPQRPEGRPSCATPTLSRSNSVSVPSFWLPARHLL